MALASILSGANRARGGAGRGARDLPHLNGPKARGQGGGSRGGATYSRVLLGTHTVAPIESLLYRRPVPPVSPGRLLLGKAGIACAVEHMDRRIGDLFWHAEALDQLGIGHEQRRLGLHVTSRGTLLAAAGLGCPVDRSIALVLVHSPTPPRKATDFCRAAIL